jgi:hypothetical protein
MGTITVTCTATGCSANGVAYTVPADGFPVTCGGCHAILVEAA